MRDTTGKREKKYEKLPNRIMLLLLRRRDKNPWEHREEPQKWRDTM